MPPRNQSNNMSVEEAFRTLIRNEIESQLRPLQDAVNQLNDFAARLAPLTSVFGGGVSAPRGAVSNQGATARKGRRGRPPKSASAQTSAGGEAGCGIKACPRPSRSKGYCAAHYQKLRTLSLRGQRPADWIDFPQPHTVEDVVLPRGRAAAKAKAAAGGLNAGNGNKQ